MHSTDVNRKWKFTRSEMQKMFWVKTRKKEGRMIPLVISFSDQIATFSRVPKVKICAEK